MMIRIYHVYFAIKIFEDGKLSHFVDGRGAAGNWMAYVNGARYAQEQNLTAIQVNIEEYPTSCSSQKLFPSKSQLAWRF